MATLGNDCYFFCTSTCTKGAACPFRHVEAAKTCRIICQHWQMGACLRPMCKFRHSDFIIQVDTSEVSCYWESQPAGCMKKNCPYKHSKPLQVDEKTATGVLSLQVDPTLSASQNNESTPNSEDIKSQNIVQPMVTSAASQSSGDSESASSSQRQLAPQDSDIQAETPKTESDDSKDLKSDNGSLSLTLQEPEVKRKKMKVPPVSKIKQKSVTTVQKKKLENVIDRSATVRLKRNPDQPRKSVKERLGRAPVSRPTKSPLPEESDSGSGSESDDSIENIKVMSVEEILRQKALESMMKKRGGESKPARGDISSVVVKKPKSLRTAEKKISNLVSALDSKTRTVQKDMQGLKKRSNTYVTSSTKAVKHFPAAEYSSSSSSSKEECDETNTSRQSSSVSSSDSSSGSSTSDTDEDSMDDSEELDIRRVVMDLESEKAARKKAKESFMKKQKLNAFNTRDVIKKERVIQPLTKQAKASPAKKTQIEEHCVKKRSVNIDYDSDDFVCSRVQEPLKLHVRDRLGKPTSLHKSSSDARLLSRAEKFGSEISSSSAAINKVNPLRIPTVSRSGSSEDDHNLLTEVKVKSLEEIRMEKMKIMAQKNKQKFSTQEDTASFKNRLGTAIEKMQNQEREVVHCEARQVVLLNGTEDDDSKEVKPSDEQKKTKKRPWRTVRSNTNQSTLDAIAGDERTSIVSSPSSDRVDSSVELDHHMEIPATDESPFERLRRKALMKKLQAGESKKFKKLPVNKGVKAEDDGLEKPEFCQVVEINRPLKTHKHKHGHSHKKVKTERQIYLPPAMKTAVTASKPSLKPESVSPKQDLSMAPATKVSPLKREPHPIGAAWAAGLTLSSKGISVRRPEYTSITAGNLDKTAIKVPEKLPVRDISTRSREAAPSSKMPESTPESSVTIKSFAEIMAEKRKRRLEMQAQKAGITASVATYSLEPSVWFSSSASTHQLKSDLSQSDVKSASPSIYTLDHLSDTSETAINSGQASKKSLITTVKEVTSDVSSVSSSATAMSSSTTPLSQDLARPIGQKVRLKSMKRNNADKRNKIPKLFTKRSDLQPSSQSCTVTSEDSTSNISSSPLYPNTSTLSQTVTPSRDNTSLLHGGFSKTSHPTKPVSTPCIETTTIGVNITDNGTVSKLPIYMNAPDIKEHTHSSKQKVAVLKEDSDHAKMNTRLSLEDEFSFFEDDDDMFIEDSSILENIEPIDNLLQDIDDLLS